MHPDDLKKVWVCRECLSMFVFQDDVDYHIENEGHRLIEKMDFQFAIPSKNKEEGKNEY